MANTKGLTKLQRRILWLMGQAGGGAAFMGGTREFLHGNGADGLVIQAYMEPEVFLKRRGLIEPWPRNVPGHWFRLTDPAIDWVNRLKEEPPAIHRHRRTMR